MAAVTLRRVGPLPLQPDLRPDLREAARITGYLGLGEKALIADLVSLGVCPFDSRMVGIYKDRKLKEANIAYNQHCRRGAIVGFAATAAWTAAAAYLTSLDPNRFSVLFVVLPFIGMFAAMTTEFFGNNSESSDQYEWRRCRIDQYARPIPANVLLLAAKLKKALPSTDIIGVEELSASRIAIDDPFLYVRRGDATAYIAVWDEPTFNDIAMDE